MNGTRDVRGTVGTWEPSGAQRDSGGNSAGELRPGTLYIVATPIGNLQDISFRALQVLGGADIIAAEDTRRTGLLLKAFHIDKPMISYYAHNEEKQSQRIVELLQAGQIVALVSDAGTPGISDPGARVVRRTLQTGLTVSSVPGPSAGITALAASGLPTDAFAFGGFIPRGGKDRRLWLERFGRFHGSLIFYESPKRICATLQMIKEAWGDRSCCVAREITKRYEEYIRGSLSEVAEKLESAGEVRGEIVLVVEGKGDQEEQRYTPEEIESIGKTLVSGGMAIKEASRQLAKRTGMSAKACYAMMLKWDR